MDILIQLGIGVLAAILTYVVSAVVTAISVPEEFHKSGFIAVFAVMMTMSLWDYRSDPSVLTATMVVTGITIVILRFIVMRKAPKVGGSL